MSEPALVELFHAISDSGSAVVRRFVVEHGLEAQVRFRNVIYPEVLADLTARGGGTAPAVWADGQLAQGADACVAVLRRLVPPRA